MSPSSRSRVLIVDDEARRLLAKGDAAKIIENGLANVNILNQMITAYKTAQGDGEKVFILNMLPDIINQLVGTVGKLNIDKISVVVRLKSENTHVRLHLLKDHDNQDLADLHIELDPKTLLLKWE